MKQTRTILFRLLGLAGLMMVTACTSSKKPIEDLSPEQLYTEGYRAFQETDYEKAAEYFDEVEKQHPYSLWSERAQIMAAYANYQRNAYDDSLLILDRFIQLHPGNRNTPYAYYLKGLCYFEQVSDAAREQSMTQKAQETFQDLIARFPNSVYAADARIKMVDLMNHLAAQEMTVGRYYLKQTDLIPAINRFRAVIDSFPDSNQVPEAYYRLTTAYLMLGVREAAEKTAATAGHQYPDNPWTTKTQALLTQE